MAKDKEELLNVYKVVMMGCKGSGKTSMVNQFVNGSFDLINTQVNDFR